MGGVKISRPLSPELVKTYWDDQYTSSFEAYYADRGQFQGQWCGELAERFGLTGAVTREAFDRLADGQHPITGEQLVKWRKRSLPEWAKDDAAWSGRLNELLAEAAFNGTPENPLALAVGSSPRLRPLPVVGKEASSHLPREPQHVALIEIHRIATAYFQEQLAGEAGQQARGYLIKERGISEALIQEFRLGYATTAGTELRQRLYGYSDDQVVKAGLFRRAEDGRVFPTFRDRIMFPIEDETGEVVAFGGRRLSDESRAPKYMNSEASPIYSKRQILYNLNRAQEHIEKSGRLVLQEGYLDAIASYGAGVRNAVATCGTSLTPKHIDRLKEIVPGVIVNYDGDDAGRNAAGRASSKLLDAGLQVNTVTLPEGKDAAGFISQEGARAFRKQIAHAPSVPKWLLEQEAKRVTGMDWSPVDALHSVLDALSPTTNPTVRMRLEGELRTALGIESEKKTTTEYSEHRSAYDFTIAPHKSITAAAIVGRDQRLVDAHERAVLRVMKVAGEYTQVRRGPREVGNTENLVAARFTHLVARPVDGYPDPHLHTHVVVFNLSDDDGKIRAIQPLEWYRIQRYLDAIYQAEIAVELQQLGYVLDRNVTRAAAIEGYSAEYLEAISRRTTEIEERKNELGFYGAEADHIIAHQSRSEKVNWSRQEVEDYHREFARTMGVDPDAIPSAARLVPHRSIEPKRADEAITFAKRSLMERNAVIDHYEIMEQALRLGMGSLRLEHVREEMERRKHEFLEVDHYRGQAPGARYTTPEMVQMERDVMGIVLAGRDALPPMALEITRDDFRAEYKGKLNDAQMWLSWSVLQCPDRVIGVQGSAGVGKTTTLAPTRQIIEEHGYDVVGVAPTGRASSELAKAGITNAQTLQRFLAIEDSKTRKRRCIFMDESSLASTAQIHELFRKLNPEDRVILVGDIWQHQSVEAGRIFEQLQEAGMTTFHLRKILRQERTPELLRAVNEFSKGHVEQGLAIFENQGWVHEEPCQMLRYRDVSDRYTDSPDTTIAVTGSNLERLDINAAVQRRLREAGYVDEKEYKVDVLLNRQDLTNEAKQHAFAFEAGDVIQFRKSNKHLGVKARQYATVDAIDRKSNEISVSDGSKTFVCRPRELRGVQVYVRAERAFSVGDRIQFTASWRQKRIDNRDMGHITYLDNAGNMRVKLIGKEHTISFNVKEMPHLDLAYAVTSYSLQSAAYETVLVNVAALDTRTKKLVDAIFANVTVSRSKLQCEIFCDSKEDLGPTLNRLHLKPKAHSRKEIQEYAKKIEAA